MLPTKLLHKHISSSHIPSESPTNQKRRSNKVHKKKKKRFQQRYTKKISKHVDNNCISSAMSSWAESFTMAATWQLKHQIAYWKARAVSLEYENNMLHEVIRRNQLTVPTTSKVNGVVHNSDFEQTASQSDSRTDNSESDSEQSDGESEESDGESESNEEIQNNDGEDFEVSEEFIQFLTANAKYREDAKREKERLEAQYKEESTVTELQESVEDRIVRKKDLYGDNYKGVLALESYLHSDFIEKVDKLKAAYWPNIPFNFNPL